MDISNEQANALFNAGGFILLTGAPKGSQIGIDGSYYTVQRFSGYKFLPPGLHLVTYAPPSTDSQDSVPLRQGFVRITKPQERVVLRYDAGEESLVFDKDAIVSDDHVKSLDAELAPYPLKELDGWRDLTGSIDEATLDIVVGSGGVVVDGMTPLEGGEEEDKRKASIAPTEGGIQASGQGQDAAPMLHFTVFRLKKSWKEGAVGGEVTRYSQDKSWLFGDLTRQLGDPISILAQLQLSFIIFLHLSSYSALSAYKRLIPLFTRSPSLFTMPTDYLDRKIDIKSIIASFLRTLAPQTSAFPEGTFETELPEMDVFYLDEIESLRMNIVNAGWSSDSTLLEAWKRLQKSGKPWGWEITDLSAINTIDSEDEDEEGEYAPVVVEL